MITLALSVLLALLPPPPPGGGTVAGKVVLARGGTEMPDASNAVVWIEGVRGGGGPAPSAGAMKSEQKKFAPRVVVVRRSSTVQFPNADSIYHNAFSVSCQNRFDLGLYRSGASATEVRRAGAGAGLLQHPPADGRLRDGRGLDFAAVTGPDGLFRFEGVPPGQHVVKVWHEERGESQSPVAVHAGADPPLAIRLDVTNFRPIPHKNKYGKDYPPGAGTEDERY
jgi:hypothetical protein